MAISRSSTCPAAQCTCALQRHEYSDCTFCDERNTWLWCNICGVYCKDCDCDHENHPSNFTDDEEEEEGTEACIPLQTQSLTALAVIAARQRAARKARKQNLNSIELGCRCNRKKPQVTRRN